MESNPRIQLAGLAFDAWVLLPAISNADIERVPEIWLRLRPRGAGLVQMAPKLCCSKHMTIVLEFGVFMSSARAGGTISATNNNVRYWLIRSSLFKSTSACLLFGSLLCWLRRLFFRGLLDGARVAVGGVLCRDLQSPCRGACQQQRVLGEVFVSRPRRLIFGLGGHPHQPAMPLPGGVHHYLVLLFRDGPNDGIEVGFGHFCVQP